MEKYIMALDAGTTSNRCIIFDHESEIVSIARREFTQYFPKPGLVEHDASEIFTTMYDSAKEALEKAGLGYENIAGIGITNQRETAVLWNKETGEPVYHAIVWQDRRTAEYCDSLEKQGLKNMIQKKTGLLLDPYFSGTKIHWILKNIPEAEKLADEGKLLFGTIETWLIWKFSGGKIHVTDYSNASRTMLFNINTLTWDDELLSLLEIPKSILPKPVSNSEIYGETDEKLFGGKIRISGAAGDQQAALFGQACFNAGEAKNTYGTGGFLLMNIGEKPVFSENGLVTTVAWGLNGRITYALEGSVFVSGSAIQWLRDKLGLISSAAESEELASKVNDTNGCYMVPAFTGLGAPYWDPYARGAIVGLTRGVEKCHIVRATLEGIAFQSCDVLKALEKDAGVTLEKVKVDGGASANNLLMQMQSDFNQLNVIRPKCVETTAMGAAFLAGLSVGYYKSLEEIEENRKIDRVFVPQMSRKESDEKQDGWHKAVKRSMEWA